MVTSGLAALKCLAIGLIVLPEPFTTLPGVALLCVALFLAKREKAKNGRRTQELVSLESPTTPS